MLALVRRHWLWFAVFLALGIALRLLFVYRYSLIDGDTLIYGDIALNWIRHGIYGVTGSAGAKPTLIRLPGYPAFLALCFRLFGAENYRAVMLVQTAIDLMTAFVVAAIARELTRDAELTTTEIENSNFEIRISKFSFALYCLFPYTANYVSQPLAETPTLFTLSLAILLALRALRTQSLKMWFACGLACAATVLLRPDGGLILISLGLFLLWRWWRTRPLVRFGRDVFRPALVLALCTVAALTPWTVRNRRTFGVWQPLAPTNATDPDDFFPQGFTDWTKTWVVEEASMFEIVWNVPGGPVDPRLLPARAFDSSAQKQHTLTLLDRYNEDLQVPPDLDAQFAALAAERRQAHPLRYYVVLPVARVLDMWLRPRIDTFPIDPRWWDLRNRRETRFAAEYAFFGIVILVFSIRGWWRLRRLTPLVGVLTFYIVLRTLFLLTVPTSEPRYTIECWPMLLVLAGGSASPPTIARQREQQGVSSS